MAISTGMPLHEGRGTDADAFHAMQFGDPSFDAPRCCRVPFDSTPTRPSREPKFVSRSTEQGVRHDAAQTGFSQSPNTALSAGEL
ncbi:hypothetical protein [Pseudomonas sp. CGJS7]|uniref:hypothetical protein n=1 Tax=Pseudomonas sp. CGJS7 TaxID=3109348 RepID=UPI00300A141B